MTHCAPTLDELMADPLIQATMRADRVDPIVLRQDLLQVADRLGSRPRSGALALEGARVRFGTEPKAAFVGPRLAPASFDCEKRLCF